MSNKRQLDWIAKFSEARGSKKPSGKVMSKKQMLKKRGPVKATIFYHGQCPDGSTAAMLLREYEKQIGNENVSLRPIRPGANTFAISGQERIYMVDVVADAETVAKCKKACKEFILLDHHKSSIEILHGVHDAHIDCTRCGSMQAMHWIEERVGKKMSDSIRVMVDYINDMDLALNKLDRTNHAQRVLRDIRKPEDALSVLKKIDKGGIEAIADEGKEDWDHLQEWLSETVPLAAFTEICGVQFATITLDGWSADLSDLGNAIAEHFGAPACVKYTNSTGEVHMLRSVRGAGIDVSEIAVQMGGGGHKHAAAFKAEFKEEQVFAAR